jgi:DNA-binding FrmR family transcriptional regulator
MAKARRIQATGNDVITLGDALDGREYEVNVQPGEDEPHEIDEVIDQEYDSIQQVRMQLGEAPDSATIHIYRVREVRKNEAWLFETTPGEFKQERILQEYGAGLYRVIGTWPKGSGRRGLFINRLITVEEPLGGIVRKVEQPSDNKEVMVAIAAMQSGFEKAMLAIAGAIQSNAQVQPKETETDFLNKMLVYQKLFTPATVAQSDPLESISKILALKNQLDLLGGGNGESSIMPTLLTMAKPIIEGLTAQQTQQKINAQALPLQHPIEPIPPQESEPMNPMVAMYIKTLISAAEKQSDPGVYAELILDQMPDNMLDDLLNDKHWFDKLSHAVPAIKPHEAWFKSVHENMVELTTDPEDDTSESIESTEPIKNVAT